MKRGHILLVDEDEDLRRVLKLHLDRMGHRTTEVGDALAALDVLGLEQVDLVISGLNLPGMPGLDLLKKVQADYPTVPFVIVTAHGTIETALEAIRSGARDYLTEPIHPDELEATMERVLEHTRLVHEVSALRETVDHYGFESVIGQSPRLLEVLDSADRVARTDATVLILGETGTGKELLAKAIHFNSPRRDRLFAVINCASIPRELLESELFGYVKGSFTGAHAHKKGRVEVASGGTVFLDEIGEMPLELQVRVLRLIQEREIEKVGSTHPVPVDVRIIAATHRNLEDLVKAGAFREDLYYRLAVIPIRMPPLRERLEDIPALVDTFMRQCKLKHGKPGKHFPSYLLPYFTRYHWPGNVRELQNVVERLVVLSTGDEVTTNDLPMHLLQGPTLIQPPRGPIHPKPQVELEGMSLNDVERNLILEALRKFEWNQSRAARYLAITRKTLMYRIAKYGIEKEVREPDVDPNSNRKGA
jgi:two-component system NtrC family response regulator